MKFLVKFRKIWQTDNKPFTLVKLVFQENLSGQYFCKNQNKFPLDDTLLELNFDVLKSGILPYLYVEILEDFTKGNSRKPQIKPYKR